MKKILWGIVVGIIYTLVGYVIIAYKQGKLKKLSSLKTKYVTVKLDR